MSSRVCDADAHQQLVTRLNSPTFVVRGNALVEANDAALKLIGASRDELAHIRFSAMFVDPRGPEQLREAMAGSSRSALQVQLRLRSVEGVEQEVAATVTPCAGEDASSMHVIVTRAVIVALGAELDRQYAVLFDSAGHAMFVIDAEHHNVLAANQRASEMYQRSVEELVGQPLDELIGEESAALVCGSSDGQAGPIECEVVRTDGTSIDLETSASVIAYRGRQARLLVQRDISARKKMQSALHQIEQRFDLFVNSVSEYAMMILDGRGRVEAWNSGAERLTGYTAKEAVGKHFSMFYTVDDRAIGLPNSDLVTAARAGSFQYDAWQLRKDHKSFYGSILLTPMKDDAANLIGYARIVRDSTDRLRVEQERAALNASLELIAREWVGTFDAIDSPVVLVDEGRAVRRLNRAAQKLAGMDFAQILERRLSDLDGEPWITANALAASAIESGSMVSANARDADRSWHLDASVAEFEMMTRRIIIVIRDTTETRRLEQSLRQSEVASALGTMIAGVAHEVRRPLFQLSATVDACEARMGDNADFQRYAPHLRSSVATLSAIIRELLDYTREQPLICALNAPGVVATEAVRQCLPAAKVKNVTIAIDDHAAPAETWYDGPRMAQVLQNVIENAIQHTPADSTVTVHIRPAANGGVEFIVEDDGSGFSTEDLERAVQAFYTRRSGGTGLGLAIVKKIVDAHGGTLKLANRAAGGAAVSITLLGQPHAALESVSSS